MPRTIALLLFVAACGAPARATEAPRNDAPTTAPAARTVHDVDWLNRTYHAGLGDGADPYTVKDGSVEFAFDEEGNLVGPDYVPADPDAYVERGWFEVAAPELGDVTGDGVDDAVIVTVLNTGGTGNFSNIDVYTMKDGEPAVIGGIPGGDRGDGGVAGVSIRAGTIVVERNMTKDGDGACCPSLRQIEVWRWDGASFVEDEAVRQVIDEGGGSD